MSNWLSYEFQVKHFKYEDCSPERFYTSQWGDNVWIFCAYKCLIALYWLGWITAALVLTDNSSYTFFLTNWGAWAILLYFLVSSGVCIYGIGTRNSWGINRRNMSSSNTISKNASSVPSDQPLRWFHVLNWILHTVAFDSALVITVLYWDVRERPSAPESALSINNHSLNFFIMFLDLFIISIPERLLHSVHSIVYALAYISYLLILHRSGVKSSVYPVTYWADNLRQTTELCVDAAIATVLSRCVAYSLYKLREFIASKTMSTSSVFDDVTHTCTFKATWDHGKDNLSYETNYKDGLLKQQEVNLKF